MHSGVVGDDAVWRGPELGTVAEQFCSGCGARFSGEVTAESRVTKFVYPGRPLGRKCSRCVELDAENLSAASDQVRDVAEDDFRSCLEQILLRGRALCVPIVDATDFEATCIASTLREVLHDESSHTVLLALNKTDLLPRFDEHDLAYMRRRLEERGIRCVGAHAVSAITGQGVQSLAAAIVDAADARNVIVCGAASVGKSTLINQLANQVSAISDERAEASSRALPLTAFEKKVQQMHAEARARNAPSTVTSGFSITLREEREEAVGRLSLTESPMPGTTLGAIAIPCLGSWSHALFDTPGVVLRHALGYSLFPVHLMAPLMEPARLRLRAPIEVRAGESVLLEAAWMDDERPAGETSAAMTLARVDVGGVRGGGAGSAPAVACRLISSPVVRARVVPTGEAPSVSEVPARFLERKRAQFVSQGNHSDAEALGLGPIRRALDCQSQWSDLEPHLSRTTGARAIDVAFANVGWLALYDLGGGQFSVTARPVEGSLAWARPPLYEFVPELGAEGGAALAAIRPEDRTYNNIVRI